MLPRKKGGKNPVLGNQRKERYKRYDGVSQAGAILLLRVKGKEKVCDSQRAGGNTGEKGTQRAEGKTGEKGSRWAEGKADEKRHAVG